MIDESLVSGDLTCPACHFRCKLVKYQCGRGKEFFDIVAAGGELPEKRGLMLTPSERAAAGGDGRPPLNRRVMHALNIAANKLQKRHAEAGERKVILSVARAGSFVSVPMLQKRMLVLGDEFQDALDEAEREGLVSVGDDDHVGRAVRLTEAGATQAAAWQAERDEATAAFLSPLSEREKEELERMLRKLISNK